MGRSFSKLWSCLFLWQLSWHGTGKCTGSFGLFAILEIRGLFGAEAATFLRLLVSQRAAAVPAHPRPAVRPAWVARWAAPIPVAVQRAYAGSLLELPLAGRVNEFAAKPGQTSPPTFSYGACSLLLQSRMTVALRSLLMVSHFWCGAQLTVNTTPVFGFGPGGPAVPPSAAHNSAAAEERIYPELNSSGSARSRVPSAPPLLRAGATVAYVSRWFALLSLAAARAVAASHFFFLLRTQRSGLPTCQPPRVVRLGLGLSPHIIRALDSGCLAGQAPGLRIVQKWRVQKKVKGRGKKNGHDSAQALPDLLAGIRWELPVRATASPRKHGRRMQWSASICIASLPSTWTSENRCKKQRKKCWAGVWGPAPSDMCNAQPKAMPCLMRCV